jgi:hypothetical protein
MREEDNKNLVAIWEAYIVLQDLDDLLESIKVILRIADNAKTQKSTLNIQPIV